MRFTSDWCLDTSISEQGQIIRWTHMVIMPLGYWGNPKPCDHILNWCMEHLGEAQVTWRAYKSDFGAKLIVQFTNEADSTLFALTWSDT